MLEPVCDDITEDNYQQTMKVILVIGNVLVSDKGHLQICFSPGSIQAGHVKMHPVGTKYISEYLRIKRTIEVLSLPKKFNLEVLSLE